MSNIKISEMPSATSLDGTELVPIVQSGVSKKATVTQMYPAYPKITQVSLTPQSSGITIYANHSCAIEFPTGKLVTICASIRGVSVSSGSWRKYRYNSRRL